jgi:hypothetical protein
MKKLLTVLLAAGLVLALTLPASAFDSEFGGFWRTRAYTQQNFDGSDAGTRDLQVVDTRTRLFYTAVFSEDFKFVNKFEFNTVWGDTTGGNIGTDGTTNFRIKNSYGFFNFGPVNVLLGLQPRVVNRGFLFDDDYAGAAVTYKGEGFSIPFIWMKAYEGGQGKDKNDNDVDYLFLNPTFTFGKSSVKPTLAYIYSKDASKWPSTTGNKELGVYLLGLDADLNFDMGSLWFTGLYEGGSADLVNNTSMDVNAYLVGLGGTLKLGDFDIHGQFFYATGDDRTTKDKAEAFFIPRGQSYYWAEIMGLGLFDNQASANACGDKISNIMAGNLGFGFKATDKLKFTFDVWQAMLAEKDTKDNDMLGTEIDFRMTYSVMKNLNLDLVAAYLFAGGATYSGTGDKDAYELGAMLSFSF